NPTVDLLISRDNGATYTPIQLAAPNTGSTVWTVSPPGTNTSGTPVFSALLKVKAVDCSGNPAEDVSDAPFSIFDAPTAVLLTAVAPKSFALGAIWPNPTKGPMQAVFSVPMAAPIRL